jgi:DNA-directed RNA polymerase specialized sigma24 family protein
MKKSVMIAESRPPPARSMDASAEISVSQWLAHLHEGDESAAQQELWNRYFHRLVQLARKQLADAPRASEDEEDVALSALDSFFGGMRAGKFPDLHDREALWPLLARITACKAINQFKRQTALKRGAGRVLAASALDRSDNDLPAVEFIDSALSPASLAEMSEQCQLLLESLPDPTLRQVAKLKLAGYSTQEISRELDLAPRSVERKTGLIRKCWQEYARREFGMGS